MTFVLTNLVGFTWSKPTVLSGEMNWTVSTFKVDTVASLALMIEALRNVRGIRMEEGRGGEDSAVKSLVKQGTDWGQH